MTIYYINSNDSAHSRQRTMNVKHGKWRQVTKGVYTDDLNTPLSQQATSAIFKIIGHVYPDLIISHRSAQEYRPYNHCIYVTGTRNRKRDIQGIKLIETVGPTFIPEFDQQVMGTKVSGTERMLLENLQVNRGLQKTLGQSWVEGWLENLMGSKGEDELNRVRERAREIAKITGWQKEFTKLNNIVGTLLGSHKGKLLNKRAIARGQGEPFDEQRDELFSQLTLYLKSCQFIHRHPQSSDVIAFENTAFWDAYFSNYIEGTRFPVDEAEDILFNRKVNPNRHEDSHNIIRSYDLLSGNKEMNSLADNADDFLDLLIRRHRYFMAESLEKKPGEFKTENNVAGNTFFVEYDRVEGTLTRAFQHYTTLDCPVKKALYIMFVVTEVHPFADGNGRIARTMLNAELISAGLERIIIPTCFRDDYLSGLRSITRNKNFNAYCRMMDRAHHFTANFYYLDLDKTKEKFKKLGVFEEGRDGRLPELGYRKKMSLLP